MNDERRRYFRIDDTVGISYRVIEGGPGTPGGVQTAGVMDLVTKQDEQIEKLLLEVGEENPKVAELVTVFNQKLERIVSHMAMEYQLVDRIAQRVREANISACGMAFHTDDSIEKGARLRLELTLYPSDKILVLQGLVVECEPVGGEWYLRIDFYDLSEAMQENLIQHVVQSQSQQLKKLRGN